MANNFKTKRLHQSLENILIDNQSHKKKIDLFLRIIQENLTQLDDIIRYFISRVHGSNFKPYLTILIIALCRIYIYHHRKMKSTTRTQVYSLLYFIVDTSFFQASPCMLHNHVVDILGRDQTLLNRLTKQHSLTASKLVPYIDNNHSQFFILYQNLILSRESIRYISIGLCGINKIIHLHSPSYPWQELAIELLKMKDSPLIGPITNLSSNQQVSILCQSIQLAVKILQNDSSFRLMNDMINIILPTNLIIDKLYSNLINVTYSCSILQILTIAKSNLVHILNNYDIIGCQICQWLIEQYNSSANHQQEIIIHSLTEFIIECPNEFELYSKVIHQVAVSFSNLFGHASNPYIRRLLLKSLDQIFKTYRLEIHANQAVNEIFKQLLEDRGIDPVQQCYLIDILANFANYYSNVLGDKIRAKLWLCLKEDNIHFDSTVRLAIEKVLICKYNACQVEIVQSILLSSQHESNKIKAINILQEYSELSDSYFEANLSTLVSVLKDDTYVETRVKIIRIFILWIQQDYHSSTILQYLWLVIIDSTCTSSSNELVRNQIVEQLLVLQKLNREQVQYLATKYSVTAIRKKALQHLTSDAMTIEKKTLITFLISHLQFESNTELFKDILNAVLIILKSTGLENEYQHHFLALIKNPSIPKSNRVMLVQCNYWQEVEKWKNTILYAFEDALQIDAIDHLFRHYFELNQEEERKAIELLFLEKLTCINISPYVRICLKNTVTLIDKIKSDFRHVLTSNGSLAQQLHGTLHTPTDTFTCINNNEAYLNIAKWQDLVSRNFNATRNITENSGLKAAITTLPNDTIVSNGGKAQTKSEHSQYTSRNVDSQYINRRNYIHFLFQLTLIIALYIFTIYQVN
ncbi:uncharacterized protein TRIADDRAFT_58520 [Trichoplax adhaerens]|uniref:Uncharacterized protein n=1 Tax=Trichoplax adhaerens TaxID=10228 RepID=B3S2X6_TRIAD|nr:predicted protein [Trichoplax adhaerens]EDV22865.1 predicted protein [Trichoplax adhaerens]|eukprot:XP_002114731.1 predicted protein [Trichoplax adhaerens]